MILANWYILTAIILLFIGIYGIVVKRNAIKVVIGIEILTAGVNLNFLALGATSQSADPLAESIVIVSIIIGACLATVALMFVIQAYRHYGAINLRKLRKLRW